MLRDRLILGISLALLALLPFVLPGGGGVLFFLLLTTAAVGLLLGELFSLFHRVGMIAYPRASVAFGCGWIAAGIMALQHQDSIRLPYEFWWLAMPVVFVLLFLPLFMQEPIRRMAVHRLFSSLAGVVFIIFTLGLLPLVYFWPYSEPAVSGRLLALYVILATKMGDVGAYAAGVLTARRAGGNHKMMPSLSPGKSWEGLLGGIGAAVGSALLFAGPRQALFGNAWLPAIVFGMLCAVVGLVGDLLASLLKRGAGVKDSGRLPGLGGVLDMCDSLILVVPLFYLYLRFSLTH